MRLRHIKGKKSGIVGSAISNFWSYVIFVFVVIIFFVFFFSQVNEKRVARIESLEGDVNLDTSAINYLRTPIVFEIDGGGILIARDKTFADFIVQKIGPLYLAKEDPVQNEIHDVVEANIEGFDRLMIIIDGGGCPYDSKNDNCLSRQPSYVPIPEGVAILPISVRGAQIEFVEVVFQ